MQTKGKLVKHLITVGFCDTYQVRSSRDRQTSTTPDSS